MTGTFGEVTETCLGKGMGMVMFKWEGSVCVGKLEHFTWCRRTTTGGALLPQIPLIKDI